MKGWKIAMISRPTAEPSIHEAKGYSMLFYAGSDKIMQSWVAVSYVVAKNTSTDISLYPMTLLKEYAGLAACLSYTIWYTDFYWLFDIWFSASNISLSITFFARRGGAWSDVIDLDNRLLGEIILVLESLLALSSPSISVGSAEVDLLLK